LSRLIVTRAEFQELAEQRLAEAKALLDQGQWDGAYYLAGYAVELALKACIIKILLATDAFPDKEFSKNCYTHAVEKLVVLAKLDGALKTAAYADPDLLTNWALARDWSEEKRYHRIDKTEAEALYAAIADAVHGVLPWIKTQW
jgi:HEPN domain-containing protein